MSVDQRSVCVHVFPPFTTPYFGANLEKEKDGERERDTSYIELERDKRKQERM